MVTNISDGLAVGGFFGTVFKDPAGNTVLGFPTHQCWLLNFIPLTAQVNNVAVSQHMTASTPLTLAAGTGTTYGRNAYGQNVVFLDVTRAVSLTSTANLSAINFTIVGYDIYGQKLTQVIAGPNNNTVHTLKTFIQVLSVTPSATDGTDSVSIGTADVFGFTYLVPDANYITPKFGEVFAIDAGTFVAPDLTSPATSATGDVRGTYAPSAASNGTKRLTISVLIPFSQQNSTGNSPTTVFGVAQA